MFSASTTDLRSEEKGGITHYPQIETNDFRAMYIDFHLDNNVKIEHKVIVDIMLFFGRRSRENIHKLKINDFAATAGAIGHLYSFMPNDELAKITTTIQK